MKIYHTLRNLIALTLLTSFSIYSKSAQALNWNVNLTAGGTSVIGTFNIDNEDPLNDFFPGDANYPLTSASIVVGPVTYTNVNNFLGSGISTTTGDNTGLINGITIIQDNGTGGCALAFCSLSLTFLTPLSSSNPGGNFGLVAAGSNVNQQGLSSSISNLSNPTTPDVIPFNFSTTPGLVVLGLITGVAKGRKYLPQIKGKLSQLFLKK